MSDLTLTRIFDAPRDLVFKAWTDSAMMSRWFFPGDMVCHASCDFRVGGSYRLEIQDRDGNQYPHHGEYRDIVDQQRISFTWTSKSVQDSLVTLDFEDLDGQTRLTLVHQHLVEPAQRENHNQGWQSCLANLDRFLQEQQAA